MKTCLSCQQPILSIHEHHQERRRERVSNGVIWTLILVVGLSLGYLVRDSVFLKKENSVLWKLVNVYVGKVEVDKVATENVALRAKVRQMVGK